MQSDAISDNTTKEEAVDEMSVGLSKPARSINTPDSTIDELTTQGIGELVQVIESTEEFLQIIT